jgi:hypothetical protein
MGQDKKYRVVAKARGISKPETWGGVNRRLVWGGGGWADYMPRGSICYVFLFRFLNCLLSKSSLFGDIG